MESYSTRSGEVIFEPGEWTVELTRGESDKGYEFAVKHDGTGEYRAYADDHWVSEHFIAYVLSDAEANACLDESNDYVLCISGPDAGIWLPAEQVDPSRVEYDGPGIAMGCDCIAPSALLSSFQTTTTASELGECAHIFIAIGD